MANSPASTKTELTELYGEFIHAVVHQDHEWLERHLADDFGVFIGPTGAVLDKQDYITQLSAISELYIEMGQVEVLELGDYATVQHTAIVDEELVAFDKLDDDQQQARDKSGIEVQRDTFEEALTRYFTATWRRSPDGVWQVVLHGFVGFIDPSLHKLNEAIPTASNRPGA